MAAVVGRGCASHQTSQHMLRPVITNSAILILHSFCSIASLRGHYSRTSIRLQVINNSYYVCFRRGKKVMRYKLLNSTLHSCWLKQICPTQAERLAVSPNCLQEALLWTSGRSVCPGKRKREILLAGGHCATWDWFCQRKDWLDKCCREEITSASRNEEE